LPTDCSKASRRVGGKALGGRLKEKLGGGLLPWIHVYFFGSVMYLDGFEALSRYILALLTGSSGTISLS